MLVLVYHSKAEEDEGDSEGDDSPVRSTRAHDAPRPKKDG